MKKEMVCRQRRNCTRNHFSHCYIPHEKSEGCLTGCNQNVNNTKPSCIPYYESDHLEVDKKEGEIAMENDRFDEVCKVCGKRKGIHSGLDSCPCPDGNFGTTRFKSKTPKEYRRKGEKKMKREYEILKLVSIKTVNEAGACSEEMRRFALHFLPNYGWEEVIGYGNLFDSFEENPSWKTWLIEKGFVEEKKPEVFYKRGDRFQLSDNNRYILVSPEPNKACLICLFGGIFWKPPCTVEDVSKITEFEFSQIYGYEEFIKIEKDV